MSDKDGIDRSQLTYNLQSAPVICPECGETLNETKPIVDKFVECEDCQFSEWISPIKLPIQSGDIPTNMIPVVEAQPDTSGRHSKQSKNEEWEEKSVNSSGSIYIGKDMADKDVRVKYEVADD